MEEIHQYFDLDFFKKYGWVCCYECDKIFFVIEELIEHQEECDRVITKEKKRTRELQLGTHTGYDRERSIRSI